MPTNPNPSLSSGEQMWRQEIREFSDDELERELDFCRGGAVAPGGLGFQEREYLVALEAEHRERTRA